MNTLQGKLPANLVSLAEARACKPNWFTMVVVCLIMGSNSRRKLYGLVGHLDDTGMATIEGTLQQGLQVFVAIAQGARRHWAG